MIDKIKQIKQSRMEPEEIWFLDLITDLEEVRTDKYPNSIFWKKDGGVLFEHDLKYMRLLISYEYIWSVFYKKFKYSNSSDIQLFINNIVKEYLNWKSFTRYDCYSYRDSIGWKDI